MNNKFENLTLDSENSTADELLVDDLWFSVNPSVLNKNTEVYFIDLRGK